MQRNEASVHCSSETGLCRAQQGTVSRNSRLEKDGLDDQVKPLPELFIYYFMIHFLQVRQGLTVYYT